MTRKFTFLSRERWVGKGFFRGENGGFRGKIVELRAFGFGISVENKGVALFVSRLALRRARMAALVADLGTSGVMEEAEF